MAKFKEKDTSKMTEKQLAKYNADRDAWARYGKSKAMYDGVIRSAIRKLWMTSKGRSDALKRSRIPNNTGTRHKFLETCEVCGKSATIGEKEVALKADGTPAKRQRTVLVVHHVIPCPEVFAPDFILRMFCEDYDNPADGLSVLCHDCHTKEHEKIELIKGKVNG